MVDFYPPNEIRIHVAQGRQNEETGERVVESSRSMLNQAEAAT